MWALVHVTVTSLRGTPRRLVSSLCCHGNSSSLGHFNFCSSADKVPDLICFKIWALSTLVFSCKLQRALDHQAHEDPSLLGSPHTYRPNIALCHCTVYGSPLPALWHVKFFFPLNILMLLQNNKQKLLFLLEVMVNLICKEYICFLK